MLVEKATQVYSDLSSFTALTSLLTNGADSIRPLIAESEDGDSFITYMIKFENFASKDRATDFQVIVQSWATDYNDSLAIADQVEAAFGASSNFYKYLSANANFNEQLEIYTEQIFNIKK